MTKEKLAYLLNGREYGLEISSEEEKEAEESGLIVIFGYSDDGVVFAGKISDQFGGWDGKSFRLDKQENEIEVVEIDVRNIGFVNSLTGKESNMVHAIWSPKEPKASWLITSDIPHATFNIDEDCELFCRGIVIDIKDIKPLSEHGYTKEQQDRVCSSVYKWMVEHHCHSAEHAAQNDECNIDAIDLVCELAEIVGIPYEHERQSS